jgi:hypothetical protein
MGDVVEMRPEIPDVVPAKRRDLYSVEVRFEAVAVAKLRVNNSSLWLWAPAFAGATIVCLPVVSVYAFR